VRPNGRMCDKTSRWVLYHGTSTRRLNGILKEDRLRISFPGDPKVSLTTERSAAEYWASHAVFGDRHNGLCCNNSREDYANHSPITERHVFLPLVRTRATIYIDVQVGR
jgi:hypothetical protein